MSDSTIQNMYKATSSHTAAVAEGSPHQPRAATADMQSNLLWLCGSDDALGVAVNYSHIEEIDTDSTMGRLRLYLPRALVDITTDNIGELVMLIGRRKLSRLQVGKVGDAITVSSIIIYNAEKPPPKSEK